MRKINMMLLVFLLLTLVVGCGSNQNVTDTEISQNSSQENESKEEHESSEAEGDHAHGAYEWIGEYELKAGSYTFNFDESPDATMAVGFVKIGDNITDLEHHASHLMSTEKEMIKQDSTFEAKPDYAYNFEMSDDHGHIHFTIAQEGTYAIVTEHMPSESNMKIVDADGKEISPVKEHEGEHGHGHSHDD